MNSKKISCRGNYMRKYGIRDETTNLKCSMKAGEPFKTPFNGVLFSIYYFEKHFKSCFFNFKDILQHFKFVNWGILSCFGDVFPGLGDSVFL